MGHVQLAAALTQVLSAGRVLFLIGVLASTASCSTSGGGMNQSVGMMALNSIQPFASESFAKKLALLVLEDRYPRNVFSPEGQGVAVNDGDVWLITFQNALLAGRSDPFPVADGILLPRTLTFKIRKSDAAVLDIF